MAVVAVVDAAVAVFDTGQAADAGAVFCSRAVVVVTNIILRVGVLDVG